MADADGAADAAKAKADAQAKIEERKELLAQREADVLHAWTLEQKGNKEKSKHSALKPSQMQE